MGGEGKGPVPGSDEKVQPWESIAEAIQSLTEPVKLNREKVAQLATAAEAASTELEKVLRKTDSEAVALAHSACVACKEERDAYLGSQKHLLPELKKVLDFIFQKMFCDDAGHSADKHVDPFSVWYDATVQDRCVELRLSTARAGRSHDEPFLVFNCVLNFTIVGHAYVDVTAAQGFKTETVPEEFHSWREGIIYAIRLLGMVCKRWERLLARRQKMVSKLSTRVQSEMDAMKLPRIGRSKTSERK
ncbi:hypothetical protein KBB27_00320 [Patescibacteria group bacterium]|nr:hypothetical protein [Patescibacteria group bacterium]